MTIVNDDSSIVNKWSYKLIDAARGVIYDRHMFIVQATGFALNRTYFVLDMVITKKKSIIWLTPACSRLSSLAALASLRIWDSSSDISCSKLEACWFSHMWVWKWKQSFFCIFTASENDNCRLGPLTSRLRSQKLENLR